MQKRTLSKIAAVFLIVFFAVALLNVSQVLGQTSTNTWYKTYGGDYGGRVVSVIQTSDGGYTLVGLYKYAFGYPIPEAQDTWLIKVSASGQTVLDKKFNLGLNDAPVGGIQTSNGDCIIAGDTPGGFTGIDGSTVLKTCYLVKIDSSGNRVWNETFVGEQGWKIVQASNGDYAVLTLNQNSRDGFYLHKFSDSSQQSPVWTKSFNVPADASWMNHLISTSDGGFVVAGKLWGKEDYPNSGWMIKFDSQGNVQLNKTFVDISSIDAIVQTADGGYLLASNGLLLKIDSNANLQWRKNIAIGDAQSITKTSDGGYAIGVRNYMGDEGSIVGIAKVDNFGNCLWTKWYNGTNVFQIIQTTGGGYALVGEMTFQPLGYPYGLFIKTDANGDAEGQITPSILTPTPTPALTPMLLPSNSPTPPSSNQGVFDIYSNSTISAFTVNNTMPSINFVVSGPTGTIGYVKITIAKSFITNSNIKVYLDDKETSYQLEEKGDSWVITFTYQHSQHQVTICQILSNIENSNIPEWIWQVTLIAVVSGLVVAGCIVFWVAKKKT
ncbi:MAG: hypothetical protein ACQCN5_10335 [Candidatus Bathyarchaeia archaeon]